MAGNCLIDAASPNREPSCSAERPRTPAVGHGSRGLARLSALHVLRARGAHNVASAAAEDPRDNAGLRAAGRSGVGPETRGGVVAGLAFVRPYRSQRHLSATSARRLTLRVIGRTAHTIRRLPCGLRRSC